MAESIESKIESVDQILEKNKNQHELVLVIAFNKNGKIHIDSNRPTFEFVNYAINRAMYNINHLETTNVLQAEMQNEQNIKQAVKEDMEAEAVDAKVRTRGRPKNRRKTR